MLTPSLAHEIAQETASVTGLGILVTDPDGVVIGSSDPSRLGTFHEASVAVVASHEPASHTAREAALLTGVRPGLTLPIMVQGNAVGTVGITGAPARVRRFGPVVRRHTEMLLHESAAVRSGLLREHAIEDLVREISVHDPAVVETDLVRGRARDLGYDLRTERVPVQLEVVASTAPTERSADGLALLRAELVRTIRERFRDPADIVSATGSGRFVALRRSRTPGARDRDIDVTAECRLIVDAIRTRHGLSARAGIGPAAADLPALQSALQDAADALYLGVRVSPTQDIHVIGDLRAHQLLSTFSPRARERLMRDQLSSLVDQPDWPALRDTLIAWCANGFNLVAAARTLHVHRNTVIYRLEKISQLSGRDSHDYSGAITSYLACLCDAISRRPAL